jgi:hypothetical protein
MRIDIVSVFAYNTYLVSGVSTVGPLGRDARILRRSDGARSIDHGHPKEEQAMTKRADKPRCAGEFIKMHLLAGAGTQWIYEECVKKYPGFGPKQRNTINVYRHRLGLTNNSR